MLRLDGLNPSQLEAVTDSSGQNLLLVAGPGSGKTHTLTQRIFFLLEQMKIPPEDILVVTFTKDAALSMRQRFHSQADQNYPVNFGTFHSIFYQILRNSNSFGAHRAQIFTESQKIKILLPILDRLMEEPVQECHNKQACISQFVKQSEVVEQEILENDKARKNWRQDAFNAAADWKAKSFSQKRDAAAELLAAFSYFKNTSDLRKSLQRLSEEYRPYFHSSLAAFEKQRREQAFLDFDDMVRECRLLLERDPEMKRDWKSRFSHILIDEFQDINPEQYHAIKALKGEGTLLFAVGDDDQSIYGFRGADPKCMEHFERDFEAKKIFLNENYRSRRSIVEASQKVIAQNKNRYAKKLQAVEEGGDGKESLAYGKSRFREGMGGNGKNADGKAVEIKAFLEREEELDFLADMLAEEGKGEGDGKTAVLFRTNLYMQGFAVKLSARNIKFSMKEKVSSVYDHFVARDIFAYLRCAYGKGDRESLLQIVNKPTRFINREALGNGIRESALFDAMKRYYLERKDIPYRGERIRAICKLKKDLDYTGRLSPRLAVAYVLKSIGYEAYLKESAGTDKGKLEDCHRIVEWLCEDAKNYEDFADWEAAAKNYGEVLKSSDVSPSALLLMTVHGSKGLEFEEVYIPDCNEKVFPHGSLPDTECVEEERRLFYVAMTRAKNRLHLFYVTGTKKRPRQPSRFLNSLLKPGEAGCCN